MLASLLYSFGPMNRLIFCSRDLPTSMIVAGYVNVVSIPLRTGLFVKLNRPSVGRGKLIVRATTCCAGVNGIATTPKNWLCVATHTTLLAPSRYSDFGVPGKQP